MDQKKRILIFSLVYYPNFIGGAEVAIKEITDRLGDNLIFDMVTLRLDSRLPKEEIIGNVNVYRVGWAMKHKVSPDSLPFFLHLNKYFMPISAFFEAMKLRNRYKYDCIWTMMATYNSFAALFFKILNPKIPLLLSLQEGDPIPYIKRRAFFVWPLFRAIFRKANYIQTISNYLKSFAEDMGAKCPVVVVPNGVDIKHFSQILGTKEMEEWKKKINKLPGDKFIVTASRLVIKNAVSDIIESLLYLDSTVKLAIAGTGYEEKKLKALAEELKLKDRIVFLGFVSHKELPNLFKVCDVFVRPSLSEGFGNSFVEAMASKIPVVATEVGGIVDFFVDPSNQEDKKATGLFCEVSNPQDIAEKVRILIENKNIREPIVHDAFEMVSSRYDWGLIASKMGRILNGI